jgi:hypothetical protein
MWPTEDKQERDRSVCPIVFRPEVAVLIRDNKLITDLATGLSTYVDYPSKRSQS